MDDIMERALPSTDIVKAISRIPDQRLQNLVMLNFARYEKAAWKELLDAWDRQKDMYDKMKHFHEIADKGLAEGNCKQALEEISRLSEDAPPFYREDVIEF